MKRLNQIIDHSGADSIIKALIESVSEPLFVIDPQCFHFININDRGASLLGYSIADLKELSAERIFSPKCQCFNHMVSEQTDPVTETAELRSKTNHCLPVVLTSCHAEYRGKDAVIAIIHQCKGSAGIEKYRNNFENSLSGVMADDLTETNLQFPSIVGQSEKIRDVCRLIGLVAKTEATVLVQGETGTGKELVAQAIHFHSHRANGPLIELNCSAVTETLFESELFGHKKGAFTGAVKDRKGRFELADGGTIVLDEIGSMSLTGQAKLLRVLQEQIFEPLGGSQSVKVDVRVIAISNTDLFKDIENGTFREDLYYRLNSFPIPLPALRNRKQDIPFLARHFLERYSASLNKRIECFDMDTLSRLMNYSWPGNVRELENVIEYAVILEKGRVLKPPSLPDRLHISERGQCCLKDRLEIAEKQYILEALSQSNGVKNLAAKLLGIDRRNFSYFLHKHKIN